MALTKADMAESLYEELGLNKREAKELVELFFEEVRAALGDANHVCLDETGFSASCSGHVYLAQVPSYPRPRTTMPPAPSAL